LEESTLPNHIEFLKRHIQLSWCGIRGRTPAVRTSTTVVPDIASRLRRIQSQWMVVCPYERSLHGREWEYGIRL